MKHNYSGWIINWKWERNQDIKMRDCCIIDIVIMRVCNVPLCFSMMIVMMKKVVNTIYWQWRNTTWLLQYVIWKCLCVCVRVLLWWLWWWSSSTSSSPLTKSCLSVCVCKCFSSFANMFIVIIIIAFF